MNRIRGRGRGGGIGEGGEGQERGLEHLGPIGLEEGEAKVDREEEEKKTRYRG